MKHLLFISHPYKNNPEKNLKKVMRICKYWWSKGYVPIAPNIIFSYMENDRDRPIIMRVCYALIVICPTFLSYGDSEGCREELAFAKKMGKKIKIMYEQVNYEKMMEEVRDVIY